MSLRLHERTPIVTKARLDIETEFWKIADKYELTYLEAIQAIAQVIDVATKFAIRHERHPAEDCDYKGDEQCRNPICLGQEPKQDKKANVFVQYKGTDLCCDLHCTCGSHSHFDGDFAHVLKCPTCDKLWEMPTDVYPTLVAETYRTPLEANG